MPHAHTRALALAVVEVLAVRASSAHAQTTVPRGDSSSTPLVATSLSYSGELVGDASGGVRRRATYVGAAAAQFTISMRRIVGWPGLQLFAFVLGTHGGAPSDLVGDVQGVSNLEAPSRLRVEELWLQQNVFGNRLSVLAGRYDLSSEFYRLQSASLFVNSSFGIGPELALSGAGGPSIFPNTAVGARIAYKPSPNVVWRAAVLDGVPVDRAHHEMRIFGRGDGALLVGEIAALERPDTGTTSRNPRFLIGRGLSRTYTGKLAIGAWYYTAHFPDLIDSSVSGAAVEHRGSAGAYAIADRTIWSASHGGPASLSVFAQLGVGDARVNTIGAYVGGGLTFVAPFTSRSHDELGLAIASARTGSHFERLQRESGIAANAETTLELTYFAQLASWLAVQPDVQYVFHPVNAPAASHALAPGVRIALMH
jgi:porin